MRNNTNSAPALRRVGIYLVEGKIVLDYGIPSIEVIRCAKMPLKPDSRSE
jgi:DNA polymerase-3 subunit alpha